MITAQKVRLKGRVTMTQARLEFITVSAQVALAKYHLHSKSVEKLEHELDGLKEKKTRTAQEGNMDSYTFFVKEIDRVERESSRATGEAMRALMDAEDLIKEGNRLLEC